MICSCQHDPLQDSSTSASTVGMQSCWGTSHQFQLHAVLLAQSQQCLHVAVVQLLNVLTHVWAHSLQKAQRQNTTLAQLSP